MSTAAAAAPAAAGLAGAGQTRPRVLFVGLGGGSCSGKTTLAKHLLRILRSAGDTKSFILHQDDFAPKEEDLPLAWNGDQQVRDWDTPHGSIDFGKMHRVLQHIRTHASTPPEFSSHDKLNVLPDVSIPDDLISRWADRLRQAINHKRAGTTSADNRDDQQHFVVVLVDGFLAYFDPRVRSELDLRFFTRCSRDVMKSRRAQRSYITAENLWQDPPGYYDNIVWPAYVLAHQGMFEHGDVERGALRPPLTPSSAQNDRSTRVPNGSASQQEEEEEKDPTYKAAVAKEGPAGGPVRGLVILDERQEEDGSRKLPAAAGENEDKETAVPMAEMVERACGEIVKTLEAEAEAEADASSGSRR
ncbi:unnamed protein product [Tilletia controversa]|nr:unnamed protein product [Tilletia controversa]CAD6960309.1 unnamed protein product [Tilletia controversa]CAD6973059.1 unnamed protein product [Tilletia controversa]